MPNIHSNVRSLAVALIIAAGCVACGATAPATTPTAVPHTAAPTASPSPTPVNAPLAAPLMIQVENLYAARPQSGLNQADVVYEYQTEGGISRFSTLFFTTPGLAIGPVRSARLVTIKLLRFYNATLLYSGASTYVVQLLASSGLRSYNEDAAQGALFRIGSRFAPHNLYTDGSHVAAFEQRVGAHAAGYELWARTPVGLLPPGGTAATRFQVPISGSEQPIFTYQPANGGYVRTEPTTGVLNDANGNVPWTVSTIVVMPVTITVAPEIEDVNGTHGVDFAVQTSGTGQLAVGGQLYSINWTQGASGPPQLTLANGSPAPIAPGQVLFELVPSGQTVSVG